MNDLYLAAKVREAITAGKGSRTQAQRLLMAWAAADPNLLLALTKPYLKAIVGGAVQRASRGMHLVDDPPEPVAKAAAKAPPPAAALDALVERMGARFAMQPPILNGAPVRAKGTAKQASAVKALATAYLHKKFDR